jgi:hypothetical protein
VRRKYLELPIVLFEVSKVIPTLSDFEHVQKLTAKFRLLQSAQKNPRLTELAQVPMRRHLLAKLTRKLKSADKIHPVTVSREGRDIGRRVNQLPPSSLSTRQGPRHPLTSVNSYSLRRSISTNRAVNSKARSPYSGAIVVDSRNERHSQHDNSVLFSIGGHEFGGYRLPT